MSAQERDQADILEEVMQFPPGKKLIPEQLYSMAQQMLKWQIQRGEMQQLRLEKEIYKVQAHLEAIDADVADRALQVPGSLGLATDAVREQLIQQVLEELFEVRVDIAAAEAQVQALEEQVHQEEGEVTKRSELWKLRQKALTDQLEVQQRDLERLEALVKANSATQAALDKAKKEIVRQQIALAEHEREMQNGSLLGPSHLASQIAELRLSLHSLKAREQAAELQLEQLAKAAEMARKTNRQQRQADQLAKRLNLRIARQEQIMIDTEELQVLLDQIQAALQDNDTSEDDKTE
ncbi:MAG: hypothetical protein KDA86_17945 [Planctomycetaceae bacterium]|nr:hypothetical protein [Planctomycetaceae bacterium]